MPVYPRSRGEQVTTKKIQSQGSGLSPLARGTVSGIDSEIFDTRFIPARAGNRLTLSTCTYCDFFATHILPTFS